MKVAQDRLWFLLRWWWWQKSYTLLQWLFLILYFMVRIWYYFVSWS